MHKKIQNNFRHSYECENRLIFHEAPRPQYNIPENIIEKGEEAKAEFTEEEKEIASCFFKKHREEIVDTWTQIQQLEDGKEEKTEEFQKLASEYRSEVLNQLYLLEVEMNEENENYKMLTRKVEDVMNRLRNLVQQKSEEQERNPREDPEKMPRESVDLNLLFLEKIEDGRISSEDHDELVLSLSNRRKEGTFDNFVGQVIDLIRLESRSQAGVPNEMLQMAKLIMKRYEEWKDSDEKSLDTHPEVITSRLYWEIMDTHKTDFKDKLRKFRSMSHIGTTFFRNNSTPGIYLDQFYTDEAKRFLNIYFNQRYEPELIDSNKFQGNPEYVKWSTVETKTSLDTIDESFCATTGINTCVGLVIVDHDSGKLYRVHINPTFSNRNADATRYQDGLYRGIVEAGVNPARAECYIVQGALKLGKNPYEVFRFLGNRFNVPDSNIMFVPARKSESGQKGENYVVRKGKLYRADDEYAKQINDRYWDKFKVSPKTKRSEPVQENTGRIPTTRRRRWRLRG